MKEGFVFDEKKHLYYYDGKPMTGCTTILGVLAKPALIPWAAKMATDYVKEHAITKFKDDDGNQLFSVDGETLENARNAHRKKKEDAAESGTDLHALVEEYVRYCIEHDTGRSTVANAGDAPESIQPFCKWAREQGIRFIATETRLYSKELWVAGTVDLVFQKGGKRFVGDIKTYKKLWDRVPLIQCAGYALMWEEMHSRLANEPDKSFGELKSGIDGYCVICLPKERDFNEAEDVMWSFDPQAERDAFISAVKLYRYLNQ